MPGPIRLWNHRIPKSLAPAVRRGLVLLGLVAVPTVGARAQTYPTITRIAYKLESDGYKLIIMGTNFGDPPVTIPCQKCLIQELQFSFFPMQVVPVDIRRWTNTEIVIKKLAGSPGSPGIVAIKNDSLGTTVTGTGVVPGGPAAPTIKRLKLVGSGQNMQITVEGSGFGPTPPGIPGKTDVPYFAFFTWVTGANSPDYPFASGNGNNEVTLDYKSWTATKIVIGGFAGAYGQYGWIASSGDAVVAALFNVPANGQGLGPPAAKASRIP